jgi:hypothetical protein
LRLFESEVVRRVFRPETEEVTREGESRVMRCFIIYALHQTLLRMVK